MEETEVLIVGAGPSGLVLGLSLAQYEVKVCISPGASQAQVTESILPPSLPYWNGS